LLSVKKDKKEAKYEQEVNKFSDMTFDEFKNKYLMNEDFFK